MVPITPEKAYLFNLVISYAQIGIGMVCQCIILILEIAALRRHRRRSFAFLIVSTVSGVAGLLVAFLNYLLPATLAIFMLLSGLGFFLFCVQGIFTVLGILELLRDFRILDPNVSAAVERKGSA